MPRHHLPSSKEPDRSKSDYYCRICDSHMNSPQMWESHISGKRHIKNAKKEPGEPPSKVKTVKRDDVTPYLLELVEGVGEPIVGLDYMCELIKADPELEPTYTCYLCHGTYVVSNVIDHLVTTKHRLNYTKEVDHHSYVLIANLKFKKTSQDALAVATAENLEIEHGRGRPEVKMEISKYPLLPQPRRFSRVRTNRMDIDAPSTSRRSPVSDRSVSPDSEAAGIGQGIDDIDVLRDIKMMTMQMKLAVLEQMVINNPLPIKNDEQAMIILHSLQMLGRCLMQYKVRRLPNDAKERLYSDVMYPDESKTYSARMGFSKERK